MKVQSASGEKVFQFCLQKVSYDYYVAREDIDAELECNRTEINAELIEYIKTYQSDMHMTLMW